MFHKQTTQSYSEQLLLSPFVASCKTRHAGSLERCTTVKWGRGRWS